MKKIACYKCSKSIQVEEAAEFSKINCPSCEVSLTIPKILGDFVLLEKISTNKHFDSYKGHKRDSDKNLLIKVLSDCELNNNDLTKIQKNLASIPSQEKLEFKKIDGLYIAYRPFYETSIEQYLKTSRPQVEKAIYILDQVAEFMDKCLEKNIYPVNLSMGNLLMDKDGQVVIVDILFRESLYEVLGKKSQSSLLDQNCTSLSYLNGGTKRPQDSLFAFGCLSYELCCGKKAWSSANLETRNIKPDVILNLRGESSKDLKILIKDLIDEKQKKISCFKKIRNSLGLNPVSIKEKKVKPEEKKKSIKPLTKVSKSKPKRKRQASNPVPLLIGFIALVALIGIFVLLKPKSSNPSVTKVNKPASKSVEKKKVIAPTKKIKTSVKPKVKKVVVKKIEPVPNVVKFKKTEPKINRETIKAELVPLDLDFDSIVDKFDEYIEATKPKDREIEEDKIEIVSMYKDHLLIHFYRHPYTGVFHLQNKAAFRAKLVKADESDLHLLNLKSGKPIVIQWKDLKFSQFREFADYYAAAFSESFSLSENNEVIFQKISKEYIELAVVLDWYGFKKEAMEYKRKALKFAPSQVARLDLMIKEEPTN